ncbi:MAG: LysR family transcriptional regulator [Gymnodinialimonas sp.]
MTRAAAKLSLTQPTVSGLLKRLRAVFGDELFVRASHGIVPTPRADDLAPRAREIIEAAQALLVARAFDPAEDAFSVTLCGSDFLNQTLLARLTSAIVARAPKARVSLITQPSDRVAHRMGRGEIDLFFSTGDKAGLDLPHHLLFEDQLVCQSSYGHHRPGQRLGLEEVCALRHVKLRQTATAVSQAIDTTLQNRGVRRDVAVFVPNLATLAQVMAGTELVCFLPQSMEHALGSAVKTLDVDLHAPAARITVYWHPRFAQDPRHLWLRGLMEETVAQLLADRQR